MAVSKKIKVSEATVAKLRKGTMAGNLAKAKNASPELREALVRFYGAKRVNAAIGKATTPSSGPGGRMPSKPRGGPGARMTSTTKPKATAAKGTGNMKRVNEPLIDLPKALGSSQAKMTAKAEANKALLEKNKKARMERAKAKKNQK